MPLFIVFLELFIFWEFFDFEINQPESLIINKNQWLKEAYTYFGDPRNIKKKQATDKNRFFDRCSVFCLNRIYSIKTSRLQLLGNFVVYI